MISLRMLRIVAIGTLVVLTVGGVAQARDLLPECSDLVANMLVNCPPTP